MEAQRNWWFTARIRTPEGDDRFLEMQAEKSEQIEDFLKTNLPPGHKLLEIQEDL